MFMRFADRYFFLREWFSVLRIAEIFFVPITPTRERTTEFKGAFFLYQIR